ncbi:poly-beta-1,6-N-acetyl-D-glucosamine biosynthesis protein PgaD [Variovorax rhizosphaerae]|uniref:Poly-beta-1,6-N-acetyl-D-glucosamine biosynthesis protein PgaD n=1 Tax=Variovorax rhizosphaerae TaxID=1836200 RepID=A0ABU8WNT1_9BURK
MGESGPGHPLNPGSMQMQQEARPADRSDTQPPILLASPALWPPRIPRSQAGSWMRLRDLVLTLLAWIVYLWILRKPIVACIAWLSPSTGEYLKETVDVSFSVHLQPYLLVAAGLVTWLTLAGLGRRQHLRSQVGTGQEVAPLPAEAQFAARGVQASAMPAWREMRCLQVTFDNEGRITRMAPANGQ